MKRMSLHHWTRKLAATLLVGCAASGLSADDAGLVRLVGKNPEGLVRVSDRPTIRGQSEFIVGGYAPPQGMEILEDYQVLPDGTIILPPGWHFVDELPASGGIPATGLPAPGVVSAVPAGAMPEGVVPAGTTFTYALPPGPVPVGTKPLPNPATVTQASQVVHAVSPAPEVQTADVKQSLASEKSAASKPAAKETARAETPRSEKKSPGGVIGRLMQVKFLSGDDAAASQPANVTPAPAAAPAPLTITPTARFAPAMIAPTMVSSATASSAAVGETSDAAAAPEAGGAWYYMDAPYHMGRCGPDGRPLSSMTRIEKDHYRQDKIDARREKICENGPICDRMIDRVSRCKLNYFIPQGCGGGGCPPFGCYNITYPVNPWHSDCRDGGIYAAEGYGGPVSVPLAPVVRHAYNYSWGVPSSRLTPVSHMATRPLAPYPVPAGPIPYGPAPGPYAWTANGAAQSQQVAR